MRIFYRSLQAAFFLFVATLPTRAQTAREREEREARLQSANTTHTQSAQAVSKSIMTLPAPKEVNFRELADMERAFPGVSSNKREIMQGEQEDDFVFQPQPIKPGAKVVRVPSSAGTGNGNDVKAGVTSPAPILSFNGVMDDGTSIPPDIEGATGLNYVIETTNQKFSIFNKTTGALVSNVNINTFFNASGGNGYFDPHCAYDAIFNRFLVVIDGNTSGGNGGLFLAISKTSDPTGAWYVYTVDDGINQNTLLDFPLLGYNKNWVVLTANLFSGSSPTTEVYIMSRASLYAGTQGTITHFSDANSFSVTPAQTMDTVQALEYLVQNSNGSSGGNGYVQIGTISGTVASPVYTAGTQIGIAQPWSDNTISPKQPGGGVTLDDNLDTRICTAEYINGSLWFTHAVGLPASNPTYSGVDWWQVNASALTVTQFGRVYDATTPNFYIYPSIRANAAGDALLSYGLSSTSTYASAVYSFHASTDAVNTMQNFYSYKAGVGAYDVTQSFGGNRWGDYFGTAVDPVDNSFWAFGQWANSPSGGSGVFGTQIAHVGASVVVHSAPVANFQANVTTSCTGVIQFSDLSTNAPTSWLWTFGDGITSTLQNPTHTYLTNGTYTVTLKATNSYGNNTKTLTGYITINEPAGPAVTGASHCGSGTFSLSANTTNPVSWYDSTGNIVSTSNPFVTPSLTHTTTYYVSDQLLTNDSVGPVRNTSVGNSGGAIAANTYGLNFDVLKTGTLQSVYLYATAAGSITITIANSGGTVINTATVNVPAGGSRVTLNFPLAIGTGYLISWSGSGMTLYRNNASAVYPYTDANGVVSITGNSAPGVPAYYYWFYDWYVQGTGCNSQTTPVTATVGGGLNTSNATITNVACFGGATGSASITPTGGTPNYTYNWSNGQTTTTLTNVAAGTYHVTIQDASGCSATAIETITQPGAALTATATATNTGCGSPNGSVAVTATGGTTSYSYSWTGGATTASVANLSAATYHVTVTDNHACTATAVAVVNNSGLLNVSATPSANNCAGGSTGGATANISGGTSPFTYAWNNGATTASIAGVNAGSYSVTATDHSGCSGTAAVTIVVGSMTGVTTSQTNVTCFNANNGTASVSVSSGTAPYTYNWNNGSTTASVSNLAAGNYYVTVSDANHCSATETLTVSQPGSITVLVNTVQPTCAGINNGSASASTTGGTPSYTYNWSTNVSGPSISNLGAGSYSVTLTDAHSCTSLSTFNITSPSAVTANVVASNTSCFGTSDGSIQASVTGGSAPYAYLWSNSSTSANPSNLAVGSYNLTVTDAHNCSATFNAGVSQPNQIVVSTSTTDAINGQANGSASVGSVTGGNPPYVATWSNGTNGNIDNNLAAGTYTVSITDHSGCISTSTVVVNDSTVGITSIGNDISFSIYPNPAKTEITIDAGSLDKETTLVLEDILGQSLLVKNISITPVKVELANYANGVYFIELRQGGKRAIRKFVINR